MRDLRAKAAPWIYLVLAVFNAVIAAIWATLALREGQPGLRVAAATVYTLAAAGCATVAIHYFSARRSGRKP